MKIRTHTTSAGRHLLSAFTLVETIVSVMVAGIMLPTMYAGFASGFSLVQMTRENLRATQIMVQRMEAVRLASYNTLQNNSAFPTNSVEYYRPSAGTNGGGTAYTITYNWASPPPSPNLLPNAYKSNMTLVTITASWNSGKIQHTRSMQSYVAKYGIQRYVACK